MRVLENEDKLEATCDKFGNKVYGNYEGFNIQFIGRNSVVCIGANSCVKGKIIVSSNSFIKIGNNVKVELRDGFLILDDVEIKFMDNVEVVIGRRIRCYKNSKLYIGEQTCFRNNLDISCFENSSLSIGKSGMFVSDNILILPMGSHIDIGNEFLASWNVQFIAADCHAIFDVKTKKRINAPSGSIRIGNHVWIGANSTLMQGTYIKDGSIIGEGSLVKTSINNNCLAVGRPAKEIRRDVAWSRNNLADSIEDCGMEYVNFTDKNN